MPEIVLINPAREAAIEATLEQIEELQRNVGIARLAVAAVGFTVGLGGGPLAAPMGAVDGAGVATAIQSHMLENMANQLGELLATPAITYVDEQLLIKS